MPTSSSGSTPARWISAPIRPSTVPCSGAGRSPKPRVVGRMEPKRRSPCALKPGRRSRDRRHWRTACCIRDTRPSRWRSGPTTSTSIPGPTSSRRPPHRAAGRPPEGIARAQGRSRDRVRLPRTVQADGARALGGSSKTRPLRQRGPLQPRLGSGNDRRRRGFERESATGPPGADGRGRRGAQHLRPDRARHRPRAESRSRDARPGRLPLRRGLLTPADHLQAAQRGCRGWRRPQAGPCDRGPPPGHRPLRHRPDPARAPPRRPGSSPASRPQGAQAAGRPPGEIEGNRVLGRRLLRLPAV